MTSTKLDCVKCGACCWLGPDVLLSDADAERFEADPRLEKLTYVYDRPGWPRVRFMRGDPTTNRCVAFEGHLGQCRCAIHPDRPDLCRIFEVGSPECLEARRKAGLE